MAGLKTCYFIKKRCKCRFFSCENCFWQSYYSTIKLAEVSVLWFRASACSRSWSKTYTKRCTNNYLLSRNKIISSLLEMINHVLSISEYVLKNISCFRCWWKSYTKRCSSNYVISTVKKLPSFALCGWSSAFNFRIWFGKQKNAV